MEFEEKRSSYGKYVMDQKPKYINSNLGNAIDEFGGKIVLINENKKYNKD